MRCAKVVLHARIFTGDVTTLATELTSYTFLTYGNAWYAFNGCKEVGFSKIPGRGQRFRPSYEVACSIRPGGKFANESRLSVD